LKIKELNTKVLDGVLRKKDTKIAYELEKEIQVFHEKKSRSPVSKFQMSKKLVENLIQVLKLE
jgi:hypothetical protein